MNYSQIIQIFKILVFEILIVLNVSSEWQLFKWYFFLSNFEKAAATDVTTTVVTAAVGICELLQLLWIIITMIRVIIKILFKYLIEW